MSQVDSFAAAGGLSGLATRQAFNTILDAIATCSSGGTAPNNPFAGMIWRDTSTSPANFKIRNDTNTAWVSALQAFGAAAQGETFLAAATLSAQRTALGLKSAATATLTNNNDLSVNPDDIGTRGNSKAYTDAAIAGISMPTVPADWTESAYTTASGTAVDFSGLPTGITEIELLFDQIGFSSTAKFLVQLGTGGSLGGTAYEGGGGYNSGSSVSGAASTNGLAIGNWSTANRYNGKISLHKIDTDRWISSHAMGVVNGASSGGMFGGGVAALAGELDILRITRDGSGSFTNGNFRLRYK